MSAAALNYDPQDTLHITDGGIASFLTATVGDWAENDGIPQNGIAEVKHLADRLAEYGRHEDEYMVHAAEGETVIPKEVLEASPQLRQHIFAEMEAMGLDPQSYIVGSELNSINPVTGQPEFFLKKLLKKIVKVVKKVLPAVLPIALSFTPLGAVYGSALGSGIGTLMRGGKLKDALKAAVISGGIGGLTAGLKGGFGAKAAGKTFGEGFKGGVGDAFGNVGQRFGQAIGGAPEGTKYFQNPLSDTPRYGAPAATGPTAPAPTTGGVPNEFYDRFPSLPKGQVIERNLSAGSSTIPEAPVIERNLSTRGSDRFSLMAEQTGGAGVDQNILDPLRNRADSNIAQRGYDYLTAAGKSPAELAQAAADAKTNAMQGVLADYNYGSMDQVSRLAKSGLPGSDYAAKAASEAIAAGNAAAAAAGPGMLARFGPSVALAGIGAAGAGFFDPPETEEEEEEDGFPEYDPEGYKKYMIDFPTAPTYTMADIRVPGRSVGFAEGGLASLEQFPRRSGGIAGPGTERSDDVPAMLSDGEFVMTAKAVRGAGNGNRNNGMNNMYQMMRTFEGAV